MSMDECHGKDETLKVTPHSEENSDRREENAALIGLTYKKGTRERR